MATQTSSKATGMVPYRLTVRQFLTMIEANVFDEDRVELLGGVLYPMTVNDPHAFVVGRLASRLRLLLPAGSSLREEKPVQLGRFWRPQPDTAILNTTDDAFARRAPQPQDIAFLVEVSDTSYTRDSGIKLQQYAHAQIPLLWIVHLNRRQVEAYSDPHGRHGKAYFRSLEFYRDGDKIPVVIEGQDLGRIAVKEILP
jgi:Uma2 family endonuclease